MTTTVVVDRLSKRYRAQRALDRLSLRVETGEIYGLVGLNGAGKTTLLRCLLGLTYADSGAAQVLGRKLPAEAAAVRACTGALIEEPAFYPFQSGQANLAALARTHGGARVDLDAAIARVGLAEAGRRRFRGYSRGMRQRLGLAAALLFSPPLLLLDEPTEGLDPQGVHDLRGIIRKAQAEGTSVVFSSHALSEVAQLADRVGIIHHGQLVDEGPPSELIDRAGGDSLEAALLSASGNGGGR